jgi:hypothetical protein
MASFLSDSYPKPKLIESRLVNKIIQEQNSKTTFEDKATTYIKTFTLKNWKMIGFILGIIGLFYWRYKEIQNIRNKKSKQYEEDSDYESSDE